MQVLLFDLGGVLLKISHQRAKKNLAQFFGMAVPEMDKLYAEAPFMFTYERGEISTEEFMKQVEDSLGQKFDQEEFIGHWNSVIESFIPQMMDLLDLLHKRYPLYLLSNTNFLHVEKIERILANENQLDLYQILFKQIFYSCHMGSRKPEQRIYQAVQKAIGVPASEILFIDDSVSNIDAAKKLSFQTLLWDDSQNHQTLAQRLGVS